MKFFVSSCSNLVALSIFLLVTAETCDAIFCQAVNGVYRERANDPGALESPASVNLSYPYQLELLLDPTTTTTTTGNDAPDPDWVAQTLQNHIADALVFTLFDDCRVDATDKMAPVNLLKIAVQVEQPQTSDPNDYYTAHIEAVGDAAVADSEQVLAHQRLENALRIVLMSHHVARFSVQPGAILTLQLPLPNQPSPPHLVQGPQGNDNTKDPTHVTPFVVTLTVACIGTIAAVLLVVAIQSRRKNGDRMIILPIHHRHVHFVLPGEDNDDQDDVELACSDKPTSKLIMLDPTETETEISESSSSEHEDW